MKSLYSVTCHNAAQAPSRGPIRIALLMLITGIVIGLVAETAAAAWICERDNETRRIWVDYPEGGALPCQVIYAKPQFQQAPQILWSAVTTPGFCESKSEAFVSRQTGWGWSCHGEGDSARSSQHDDANAQLPATYGTAVAPADLESSLYSNGNL